MRASLCAVMLLATAAQAEMAPSADSAALFDVIHNVPEVQDVTIDTARGSLYAAVSPFSGASAAASEIVHWTLDPIRLAGTWASGTLVSDLGVSPAGLLYAAGQSGGGAGGKAGNGPRSGSLISLDPGKPSGPVSVVGFPDVKNLPVVARFNQVAFDGKGNVYLAAPTQFSVSILPDSQGALEKQEAYPQLVLKCGTPAQFSVFLSGGTPAYAASTTDGALLEAGIVEDASDAAGKAPANCFRVTNVFAYKEAPPTLNSVVHAVLTGADSGSPDAVVALEPNTGFLHLLRLDPGTLQLIRAGWIDLSRAAGEGGGALGPGAFNLLAASGDGSVIFVGGQGRGEILRFRREGDDLLPVGTLRTGDGLKGIEISPDGSHAALVMRERAGLDRIHLIRAPGSLKDGWQALPAGGDTLRRVQSELNRLGFDVGPADGILGPRTLSAIDQLSQVTTRSPTQASPALPGKDIAESEGKDVESMIRGVLLVRRPQERSD